MTELKTIFLQNAPLIDVRAPVEFKEGHFPHAVNLPLMNDEERHRVGIAYKKSGREEAIRLGHQMVSGAVKEERIELWKQFIQKNPGSKIHCFRGGLRSQISAQWLREQAVEIELIPGGYKAMRGFLLDRFPSLVSEKELIILSGKTGVGKTKFLNDSRFKTPFIDLEKIAHHRGSSFGAMGDFGYQAAQATFENALIIEFLKREGPGVLVLEDESRAIGGVEVPRLLHQKMAVAPRVMLEQTLEERVRWIIQEYVIEKTQFYGGDFAKTEVFLSNALGRIIKRLGGANHKMIQALLSEAFSSEQGTLVERHVPWVEALLKYYYDPMYEYQLKRHNERVLFRGNEKECFEFFERYSGA